MEKWVIKIRWSRALTGRLTYIFFDCEGKWSTWRNPPATRIHKNSCPDWESNKGSICCKATGISTDPSLPWKRNEKQEIGQDRAGLGYFPKIQVGKAQGKERHNLIQEEVWAGVEGERVGLRQQGAWTRWESTLQQITWSTTMQADFHRIHLLVQAVYNAQKPHPQT